MKHLKYLVLMLVATCALGGVSAAPALAEEVCQRVAEARTGNREDAQCTREIREGEYIQINRHTRYLGGGVWCAETTIAGAGNYNNQACEGAKVRGNFIKVIQGPYWFVGGRQLKQGTRQVKFQLKNTAVLETENAGEHFKIICNTSISEGVALEGNGERQGQGKGRLSFIQCHTSLSTCTVTEPITTTQTKSYLATSEETQTRVVEVFEPTQGTTYAEITLSGTNCGTLPRGVSRVTGNVAAEVIPAEQEGQEGLLVFPPRPIVSIKHEGTAVELSRLRLGAVNSIFSAAYGARLATNETFGVF